MQRSYCALTRFSRDGLFSFSNLDYVMLVYIMETLSICVIWKAIMLFY